jgi:hypothetical protein
MSSVRAERQLTLLSAGTAIRRTAMREQIAALAEQVDWSRLAETLRERKLLGVLGPRILELVGERAEEEFAASVSRVLELGRRRGAFLELVSLRLMSMLAGAGIRSAALKGPLLSEAIYGDPGSRVSGDIDLLVPPDQLRAAVEVVREMSYAAPTDHVWENGLPLLHFVLAHERGVLPPVELHWRIHWYERDFARERLLPPPGASPTDWRPAPADELVALLLFYAREGFVGLRLATDVSAWWDLYGAELAPGALERILGAYPALARAVSAAGNAAERVVGLPAAQLLGGLREPRLRGRLAVSLTNPNPRGSPSQLYADMGLIDGLLAPPRGLRAFVRRQLLPPPEVLSEQARHGARRRARSRLGRCAGVLGRYGLTLTRLGRSRETVC